MKSTKNTVLLIPENETNLEIIEKSLEQDLYFTISAKKHDEVNVILSSDVVDLIVLFYSDSVYNSIEATLNNFEIPVLFVFAANTPKSNVQKALIPGRDFVFEPVNSTDLYLRIEGLLARTEKRNKFRKTMSEELERQEHQLNVITDNIPVMIAQVDSKLNFLFTNRTYASFYRKTKQELKGKNLRDVLLSEYFEKTDVFIRKVLNGHIVQFVRDWKNSYGKDHYYNVTLIPQFEDNEVLTFYILEYDITRLKKKELSLIQYQDQLKLANSDYKRINEELKQSNEAIKQINQELLAAIEQAEKADRLKSVFLGNISHEIRTPMNAILGFTPFLLDNGISPEKKQTFANIIESKGRILLNIINDIVDISEIDTGLIAIVEVETDINRIFTEVYNEMSGFEAFEKVKPVCLKMMENKEIPLILSDKYRVKQIIKNLVSNALKFTEEGYVEYGCSIENNDCILFYVKDTGIGIKKENFNVIFEYFRQSNENYLKPYYGGTGLGLSISKGLVQLLKGNIWLDSEEGEGSTFYFTIPYKPAHNVETQFIASPPN